MRDCWCIYSDVRFRACTGACERVCVRACESVHMQIPVAVISGLWKNSSGCMYPGNTTPNSLRSDSVMLPAKNGLAFFFAQVFFAWDVFLCWSLLHCCFVYVPASCTAHSCTYALEVPHVPRCHLRAHYQHLYTADCSTPIVLHHKLCIYALWDLKRMLVQREITLLKQFLHR